MIFGGKKEQSSKPKGGDVSVIERFYHNSKSMELLVNIANALRQSNFIVKCDDNLFTAHYLGDCLAFLNTGLDEVCHVGRFSTSKTEFFKHALPVRGTPKIEITPEQTINYAIMAMKQCPTKEFVNVIPLLEEYKVGFLSSQVQNALRNIANI